MLVSLYKMGQKQLKQIFKHFDSTVEENEYVEMYKYATH